MTQVSFPFDNSPAVTGSTVSESNWSKMASLWLPSGIIKGYANELQVYADSTGRQVKVRTGKAWINGAYFESDAEVTVALTANASGSTRFDRIVVRIDWTNNTGSIIKIDGTPGAGSAPTPTNSSTIWDLNLAFVRVLNGAATIAAGDVTDERGRLDLSGGYVDSRLAGAICTSGARPTTWPVGGRIVELDTGRAYFNTGTETAPVWGHTGDTDASTTSPHHTLGTGANNAAAGNHNHDQSYATSGHTHGASGSIVGTTGAQTLSQKTLDVLRLQGGFYTSNVPVDLGNATNNPGAIVIVKAWGGNVVVSATGSAGIISRPADPNGGLNATATIVNGDAQFFLAAGPYWWMV
jgi:hypothetical protein